MTECANRSSIEKFPGLFLFQLADDKWKNLRSQFVTFNQVTQVLNHLIEQPKKTPKSVNSVLTYDTNRNKIHRKS